MIRDNNPRLFSLATFIWLISGALLISALVPFSIQQSGLDNPEPIQAFLNGNLPSITPASATSWDTDVAFPNLYFDTITVFAIEPASNRMYTGQRNGLIHFFENDPLTNTKTVFLDIRDRVAETEESGLLGIAFHPKFNQDSNYVYLYYGAKLLNTTNQYVIYDAGYPGNYYNTWGRLSRFTVDPNTHVADPNSELIMINKRLYNSSHRGGALAFDNDGYLFVALGDEGRYETAQLIDTLLEGGALRLDVDRDPLKSHPPVRTLPIGNSDEYSGIGYWIPNDNPFLDPTGNQFEEYYAVGLRNPYKMTYDAVEDRFWIGDVGEGTREEVNVLEKGGNYGWPYYEGTVLIGGPVPATIIGTLKAPTADFPHSEIACIIGGYVYRGNENPGLVGKYICGDYNSAKVWALTYDPLTGTSTKTWMGYHNPGYLSSFGQDQDGEVYILAVDAANQVHKFVPQNPSPDAPALLSQTGVFSDMVNLTPADGLIPYELNQPFWSDGAEKFRWIAIPNNGTHNTADEQIVYSETGEWQFPIGTVLVKHFELSTDESNPAVTRRLETRFLVHGSNGEYYGVTYRWRPDGLEADLLTNSHLDTIPVTTPTSTYNVIWEYPGRSDCRICHNTHAGNVLGPKSRQLNRDILYPATGRTANQLKTLAHLGIFDTNIDTTVAGLSAILTTSPASDLALPVEDRARSYIDANCSYCHRPGNPIQADFDARLSTPLANAGIINGALNSTLGLPIEYVVYPGDTSYSVLYKRAHSLAPAIMMPPLAKRRIDEAGMALIAEWIMGMSVFPVEWLSFEATVEGDLVRLDWSTASELNSDFFAVERSADQQSWNTLGQVSAAGSSSTVQNYRYDDAKPLNGKIYYRLRQVDLDGTFDYSQVVEINLQAGAASIYPNPVKDQLTIDLPGQIPVRVLLIDMQGRVALRQALQPGQRSLQLGDLPSGIYLLRLSDGQGWTQEMQVAKE